MAKYALYIRSDASELYRLMYTVRQLHSAKAAREARRIKVRNGYDCVIHVGESHPDTLPHGSVVWVENKGQMK